MGFPTSCWKRLEGPFRWGGGFEGRDGPLHMLASLACGSWECYIRVFVGAMSRIEFHFVALVSRDSIEHICSQLNGL